MKETDFCCADCRADTAEICEYYVVQEAVWKSVTGRRVFLPDGRVLGPGAVMLCIGCLEERLGRVLTPEDFIDCPVNTLHELCPPEEQMSERLRERLFGCAKRPDDDVSLRPVLGANEDGPLTIRTREVRMTEQNASNQEGLTMTLAPMPREEEPRKLARFTVAALARTEGQEPAQHMVRSEYVEDNWTAYVGPIAILLARKLDSVLARENKTAVQVKSLAAQLGVEDDEILRACHRLVRFGLAGWSDRDPTLYLARRWPSVPAAILTPKHREALLALPDEVLA